MKKACVITGTRAEYGLLKPVMEKIKNDSTFELSLLVTGSHLSKTFGNTYLEIISDGFQIDNKVDLALKDDTPLGISNSMAMALTGFTEIFRHMKPDIVILLGDRYEIFMAAAAAMITKRPIAHIHGGEITEGAYDDAFRHSITKMSQLHFTSAEEYRRRVIQMGEQPDRVFCVGALGVEIIHKLKLLEKNKVIDQIGFSVDKKTLLATFHPVTLEDNTSEKQFLELLSAFDEVGDCKIIFTKANADTDGRVINTLIDQYVEGNPKKAIAFSSLGQIKYLSVMKYCGAVIGNSSSGIIETPSMHIPTINIGDRQKGRLQAASIINCLPECAEIQKSIKLALSPEFNDGLYSVKNPYEGEYPSDDIVKEIKNYLKMPINLMKTFYDINMNGGSVKDEIL